MGRELKTAILTQLHQYRSVDLFPVLLALMGETQEESSSREETVPLLTRFGLTLEEGYQSALDVYRRGNVDVLVYCIACVWHQ